MAGAAGDGFPAPAAALPDVSFEGFEAAGEVADFRFEEFRAHGTHSVRCARRVQAGEGEAIVANGGDSGTGLLFVFKWRQHAANRSDVSAEPLFHIKSGECGHGRVATDGTPGYRCPPVPAHYDEYFLPG